jgi:hypothetical protein
VFDESILPRHTEFEIDDRDGDQCHFIVKGLEDEKITKKIFSENKNGAIYLCDGNDHIKKSEEEIARLIDDGEIVI